MSSSGRADDDDSRGAPLPDARLSPEQQPARRTDPWREVATLVFRNTSIRAVLPHLAAVGLLALLLSLFFWRLTVEHQVLSPADWIYVSHPWAADPPSGFQTPENANQGDDAFLYYPRRWTHYNESDGWWQDDYLAGGRATFSNDFLGLDFYPVSWVYRVLPFPVANGFFHAGILLAAGVSMYLLLWQLKLPWPARVYGGTLFMLNGHFIVWLGAWSLPAMLGLVPLMIFGFERHGETRQRLYLLIPAVCLAIQIYLAYIPGWVVTGGVLVIYGIVRLTPLLWRRDVRAAVAQAAAYVAPVTLGLSLAAYALVPSVASALASDYQQDRDFGLHRAGLENAWTLLFPNYWGSDEMGGGVYMSPFGDYPSVITYFGVTTLPLAAVGLWRYRRSWVGAFTVALVVFSVSQIYGIPPLSELAHLPGLKQTAVFRWNFALPLAVALLAPAGLTTLLSDWPDQRTRMQLAGIAAGVAIAGAIAALGLYADRHDAATWRFITEGRSVIPPIDRIDDEIRSLSTHMHRQVLLLCLAGGIFAAALSVSWRFARPLAIGLIALACLDLFGFGAGYNATLEREDLYPLTPGIKFLQSDQGTFRIASVGDRLDPFPAYTPNLYGLQTVNGYDHYRNDDYYRFLAPMRSSDDSGFFAGAGYVNFGSSRWPLNRNLISLLNVKYIVTPPTGLYYASAAQSRNETAYAVYGAVRQGQAFPVDGSLNAIEFLLGTGGDQPLSGEAVFRLKHSRGSEEVFAWTIPAEEIKNNRWLVLELPPHLSDSFGDEAYMEIQAADAIAERPLWVWGIRSGAPAGWQRFEAGAAVGGALTMRTLYDPGDWATPVYSGEDLIVYEVKDARPRAWGVGRVIEVPHKHAAMAAVAADSFDPAGAVVLTEEDAADLPAGTSAGDFTSEITYYSSDSISVMTDFSHPGFLVFSTRFDGGWQAEVDGKDTELLRANGIFMAVPVDTGRHTVTLNFEPAEYVWGRRITIASALLTIFAVSLYLGYGWYHSRAGR